MIDKDKIALARIIVAYDNLHEAVIKLEKEIEKLIDKIYKTKETS